MKKLQTFLASLLMAGILQIGWLTPAYCQDSSSSQGSSQINPILLDSPERSPDRQRYDPVTPGQVIKKDQDRVERYKAVPAPNSKSKGAKMPAKVQKEGE